MCRIIILRRGYYLHEIIYTWSIPEVLWILWSGPASGSGSQPETTHPPPKVHTNKPILWTAAQSTHVATAAFWRIFHHKGKISPGWWGGGVLAHPLSLHLPSPVKLQCTSTLQLSGQIHYCFISSKNIHTVHIFYQVVQNHYPPFLFLTTRSGKHVNCLIFNILKNSYMTSLYNVK